MNFSLALLGVFLGTISAQPPGSMNLVRIPPEFSYLHNGRCMDGSPMGYYLRQGNGNGTQNWAIYMEGGGSCVTQQSCQRMANGNSGSSARWNARRTINYNVVAISQASNPDFYNWNHVYIPTCSGDCHTGDQTTANSWNIYRAGHLNVVVVVRHLIAAYGMSDANFVLVSGCSSGGIGSFMNVDYVADLLPNSVVKGSPQAGWYYPAVNSYQDWLNNRTTDPTDAPRDFNVIVQSVILEGCLADHPGPDGPYLCGNTPVYYNYIKTPMFVVQNQFDSQTIYGEYGAPNSPGYFAHFGATMRAEIEQVKNSEKDGLFFVSCLSHCENLGLFDILVNGVTYGEALGDWFFERGRFESHIFDDDCGDLPCNPQCSKAAPEDYQ